jgi:oligopeptide transport system substrate-binding protein
LRRRIKLFSLLSLVLASAMVLTACFGGGTETKNSQVLNLVELQEPPNLDSAKTTDVVSFMILGNTMEGLYRLDKDNKPVLGMAAKEPEVSEDKLKWTFTLRDAKWSDGKPVTAHDFEYAWKRALDPKTASEYAYILYPLKGAEAYNTGKGSADDVGVKALDDKTLEVVLERPIPYFKDLLCFATFLPQRKDIVEKYGDKYALEANTLVYNGPFVLSDWKHNQSFQMKKNPGYWDSGVVKLEEINWQIVKDNATQVNLYNTGKLDFAYLNSEFIDAFKDDPNTFSIYDGSSWYLEMNQTKDFFKNKKIRQAISLAIDKNTYVNSILKNGSIPAGGLVPPFIKASGVDDNKKYRDLVKMDPQYDPNKAKQLWQEGLKELGLSQAPAIELLGDDTPAAKQSMEFIQEQLRVNLGAKVQITSVPFKERLERGKNQRFDLLISGWGPDYNDPMTFLDLFTSDNSFNRGKYSNPEYDELIKKSKENGDFKQRFEDLKKAEQILIEDAGIAPLYYRTKIAVKKPFIKDWYWSAIGPEYTLKWASVDTGK